MEGAWLMSDGPSLSESLLARIARRALTCGVVGLGYVGLPLAAVLAQAGFAVVGFDADPQKVAAIREGRSYIPDVSSQVLGCLVERGALRADCAFGAIADCDFVAICVPTPLDAHGDARRPPASRRPSVRWARISRQGTMVVLESTTYPGTTQEHRCCLCSKRGRAFKCRPRTSTWDFRPSGWTRVTGATPRPNTPKVVGAAGPDGACAASAAVYEAALEGGGGSRLEPGGGRDGEDPREHLPQREHRPRQRACDAVRPHGHRRVGGDRRRQDEALRLHGVLPGPRPRRPLHTARPLLSVVEGARVRFQHVVDRLRPRW